MSRNEYDDLLGSQKRNEYDALLPDTEAPLRASMLEAQKTTPERQAEVLKLSNKTLLPPAIVERNFDLVKQKAGVESNDYDRLIRETPHLASWLKDPNNSKLAHDDVPQLGKIEQLLDVARSIAAGVPEFIGSTTSGAGTLLDDLTRMTFHTREQGPYSIALQEAGQAWKDIGRLWIAPPAERQTTMTRMAGRFGQLGAQIGQMFVAPETVLPSLLSQGADTIHERAKELGKENTGGARLGEFGGAAVMGVLAKWGLGQLVERAPLPIKSAVLSRLTDVLLSAGTQGVEQTAIGIANHVIEKASIDPSQPIVQDALQDFATGAVTGGVARGILGVAMPAIADRFDRAARARRGQALFEELGKAVHDSKTFQRLPEAAKQFILQATKDGPVENVYVPVDDIKSYAQSLNQDPGDFLESITPGGKKKFEDSGVDGADIAVPISDYATKIAPTEAAAHFNEAVRLKGPEAMNAREERFFTEQAKADFTRPPVPATEIEKSAARVRDDIVGQMSQMGLMPAAVDAYAKLYESTFRTIGERSGRDPFSIYEPYRLKITRPLPEVLRSVPDVNTRLDTLIDQLRSGNVPGREEMFGKSLFDFVREKGGVKDEGGDLASREIDADRKPFQRNIINNESGIPLDTAREAAAEVGYLPSQSSISDFLDALDKEARGEPVYAQDNASHEAIERGLILGQMKDYLEARGVDLKASSNEEVRRILEGAAADTRNIDAATGTILDQPAAGEYNLEKRGHIMFGPDRRFSIQLLDRADLSTFLHETGHFYLEVLGDVVDEMRGRTEPLSEQQQRMVDDYSSLLKNLGVESRDKIAVEHHEQFARSFEAYLREGKAPSPEMRSIFRRFADWLTRIYKSLTQLRVELSPEVRGIFDRLLASDQEIEAAKRDADIRAMIEDAGQAKRLGMSDEAFRLYGDRVRDASDRAKEDLRLQYMDEFDSRQQDWYLRRRAEMRDQVAGEIQGQRDYMVLSWLKDGTMPNGDPLPEGFEPAKLDAAALEEQYGKYKDSSVLKGLRKLDLYRREGGVDPGRFAAEAAYSSADEMIQAILKLRPMDDLIEAETTDRMRQSYGDMLTDGTAAEKARDAVMVDGRSEVIAREMQALAGAIREAAPFVNAGKREARAADRAERRAGGRDLRKFVPTVQLARDIADSRIAEMRVRDIQAGSYYAAARREGNAAIDAVNRGDFEAALASKQRQLINNEMYRAAIDTVKELGKIRDHMLSFDKIEKRQRMGKAGADYLEQIDALRDRFDFSRQTNKALDKRASLTDFIQSELAKGHELAVPIELQNEARRQNYRDMTVQDLRGLNDAVSSIEHWANFKNKLLRNQAKRELDALGAEGVGSIDGNKRGGPRPRVMEPRLPGGQKGRRFESYELGHLPLGTLLRELDGWKDGGFMHENVMRVFDEAGTAEATRFETATTAVSDLYRKAYEGEESSLYQTEFVPEINGSLSKMARLMTALNFGNDGNVQRLHSGGIGATGPLSDEQIAAILRPLDARDWKFVQSVWDHIDSYWPDISKLYKTVTGVAPEKVEARSVMTRFGEMKGGYFPIKYENQLSARADSNADASFASIIGKSSYMKATTANGHTEARAEKVSEPLRADFGVVTEHLQQVIHDLTHREPLVDVGRLLGRKDIQDAIVRNYGDIMLKEIKGNIRDIALGRTPPPDWYRAYSAIRGKAVQARLGWNAVTALMHVTNISSGMARVDPVSVAKGLGKWLGSAKDAEFSAGWVAENSEQMRLRWKHRMVELDEIRDQIGLDRGKWSAAAHDFMAKFGVTSETTAKLADSYLYAVHRIIQFAEIPTWIAAHEKALASDRTPDDARSIADRAVLDAFGGGQIKDLARVQKDPLGKIFSTFMTYQLSAHRQIRELVKKDAGAGRKLVDSTMLVAIPVALGVLVHHIAGRNKKNESIQRELASETLDHGLGMFVFAREFEGALESGSYSGPAATSILGTGKRLLNQVSQGKATVGAVKSANELAGELFGFPAGQIARTSQGILDLWEGKSKDPAEILFGQPPQR